MLHYAVANLAWWFGERGARTTMAPTRHLRELQRAIGDQPAPLLLEVGGPQEAIHRLLPALRRALWQQKHAALLIAYAGARQSSQAADLARVVPKAADFIGDEPPASICRDIVWRRQGGQMELLHHCSDQLFAIPWPTGATGKQIIQAVAGQASLRHRNRQADLQQRLADGFRAATKTIPAWRQAGTFASIGIQPKAMWRDHLADTLAVPVAELTRNPAYYLGGSSGTTGEPSLVIYEASVRAQRVAAEAVHWARSTRPRFVALNRTSNLFGATAEPSRFRTAIEAPSKRIVSPGDNPTTVPAAAWRRVSQTLASFGTTALAADAQYLMGWCHSDGFAAPPRLRELIYATNASWGFQRRAIERRLGLPGRVLYHCGEVGAIAISCARGAWHLLETNVHYEIVNRGRAAKAGELGLLLLSTVDTKVRPLFRYPLGDVVAWAKAACNCGTPGRRILLAGRMAQLFVDGRGRFVTMRALDAQLAATKGVTFLSVVRDQDGLRLRYVGAARAYLPMAELTRAFRLPVRSERVLALPLQSEGGKLPLLTVPDQSARLFASFTSADAPPIRWAPLSSLG